jgi:starch phosphorylase
LSVLDGWWIEGCFEGVTGWAIGDALQVQTDPSLEARSMYQKLESSILPIFYEKPEAYAAIRRNAVAINASFFNAERMVLQYMENAYS